MKRRLLIHDLNENEFNQVCPEPLPADTTVISDDGTIRPCIGCFGCWVKTPGACVIRDRYGDMGALFARADEVIFISRCVYGGFSPFVKNVLDRSISYIHPYFKEREGEMHHRPRYDHTFRLQAWFYGEDITESEKLTAQKLVRANALNIMCTVERVEFVASISELKAVLA